MARLFIAFRLFTLAAEAIPAITVPAAVGASLITAVVGLKRPASLALPGITLKVAADFAPDIMLLNPVGLAPGAAVGGFPNLLSRFLVL